LLPAHPGLTRAARRLESLGRAGTVSASAAVERLLDPIIFGVVAPSRPTPGTPSLWYPLVAWRW
jgi:hypothetical protein